MTNHTACKSSKNSIRKTFSHFDFIKIFLNTAVSYAHFIIGIAACFIVSIV